MSVVADIPLAGLDLLTPVVTQWQHDVAAERVMRGAEWLDGIMPGWPLCVTKPLDLWDPHQCVIGQVSGGNYTQFLDDNGVGYSDSATVLGMGFCPGAGIPNRALQEAWTTLVNARRRELRH